MGKMIRVVLIVSGYVQGVGYRRWARSVAKQFHINGWVKNREDDTVEILAEGEEKTLKEFILCCQQGPDVSRVTEVRTSWSLATNEFTEFDILKV